MTLRDPQEITLFVAMNEDGEWEADADASEATNRVAENSGGTMVRVVQVTLTLSPPVMSEVEGTVPDQAGETVELKAAG